MFKQSYWIPSICFFLYFWLQDAVLCCLLKITPGKVTSTQRNNMIVLFHQLNAYKSGMENKHRILYVLRQTCLVNTMFLFSWDISFWWHLSCPSFWSLRWATWNCDKVTDPSAHWVIFSSKRAFIKKFPWTYTLSLLTVLATSTECISTFISLLNNNLVCMWVCMTVSLLTNYFSSLQERSFSDKCGKSISPQGEIFTSWDSELTTAACMPLNILDVFPQTI